MDTEYRDIVTSFLPDGHPYVIGNNGDVRSKDTGKSIKTMFTSKTARTPSVCLFAGNHQHTTVSVRKLVAEAFLEEAPENGRLIHLDGNPLNLYMGNLLWVSRARCAPRVSALASEPREYGDLNKADIKFLWRLFQTYSTKSFAELARKLTSRKKDLLYLPMYTEDELKIAAGVVLERFGE